MAVGSERGASGPAPPRRPAGWLVAIRPAGWLVAIRPAGWLVATVAITVVTACGPTVAHPPAARTSGAPRHTPAASTAPWDGPAAAAHLAPGSDPAVLPGDVLIADKKNDRLVIVDPRGRLRWQFPGPGDLRPGETFRLPDDAFFSPDGREIVATQEDDFAVTVVDVATRRIVYRYGTPGRPGAGPGQLNNPDDAMLLPDGYLLVPDIRNCRILLIRPGARAPARVLGLTTTACLHAPPRRFGSPNGAFPMDGGTVLVTEINGDWVDAMSLTGRVLWSTHPPQVGYPSDANRIGPDRYLVADYSTPGQVVVFDHAGHTRWRYRPTGAAALRYPSLALGLPDGDVIITDDADHRVIVVDPRTDRVVWQYGHTGRASSAPGYLDNPDGVDLVPPHALLWHLPGGVAHP